MSYQDYALAGSGPGEDPGGSLIGAANNALGGYGDPSMLGDNLSMYSLGDLTGGYENAPNMGLINSMMGGDTTLPPALSNQFMSPVMDQYAQAMQNTAFEGGAQSLLGAYSNQDPLGDVYGAAGIDDPFAFDPMRQTIYSTAEEPVLEPAPTPYSRPGLIRRKPASGVLSGR